MSPSLGPEKLTKYVLFSLRLFVCGASWCGYLGKPVFIHAGCLIAGSGGTCSSRTMLTSIVKRRLPLVTCIFIFKATSVLVHHERCWLQSWNDGCHLLPALSFLRQRPHRKKSLFCLAGQHFAHKDKCLRCRNTCIKMPIFVLGWGTSTEPWRQQARACGCACVGAWAIPLVWEQASVDLSAAATRDQAAYDTPQSCGRAGASTKDSALCQLFKTSSCRLPIRYALIVSA